MSVMPIVKAAIKHLRKSEKLRKVNRQWKDKLKKNIKTMLKLGRERNFDEFKTKLPEVTSLIDKCAKKHLIHKNNAARKKARLAHLLASSK